MVEQAREKGVREALAVTRQAIESMPPERAANLTTAEAAALLGLSYRRACEVLRDFRGKYKKDRAAFRSRTTARGTDTHRYDRDRLVRWWAVRKEDMLNARSRRATRQKIDDLMVSLRKRGVSYETIMDALNALRCWAVDARGHIIDSLDLPRSTPARLARGLVAGHGEGISLHDAMTAWRWRDQETRAPWHNLYCRLLHDAEREALRMERATQAERLAGPPGGQAKVVRNLDRRP